MNIENDNKKYASFKIPERKQEHEVGAVSVCPKPKSAPLSDGMFYEIEYDSGPIPGVGRFVRKPLKIEVPEKDEIRDKFKQMREIARSYPTVYNPNHFFDRRVHRSNAAIFYNQAVFMKNFTDDFNQCIPYTQYFPYYQLMGYEQLRTYFTWRTQVRNGRVTNTSLSYVFLYLYELLNNIGVNDPQDGLEKLFSFWNSFRDFNQSIDKYVLRWLKDYHIYYQLPQSFREFINQNNLTEHYPGLADPKDDFSLFCSASKYDIRKSAFFTEDRVELISNCFNFTVERIRQIFIQNGMCFDKVVFQPVKKMPVWTPFKDALFHPWIKQADRQVILSEKEIYICRNNEWTFTTVLTSESGRTLVGYILKQMEAALRSITKYKYKLSADSNNVKHEAVIKLRNCGISMESVINGAVSDFYKETTKIVVKVNDGELSRIRQEAMMTQEKLTVPEETEQITKSQKLPVPPPAPTSMIPVLEEMSDSITTDWDNLKINLTETEIQALAIVLNKSKTFKQFADDCGIMLEVLADGINEKAMDCIGDNVLDEDFALYEDYEDQIKDLVK